MPNPTDTRRPSAPHRLVHLQILRTLAASLVVVDHTVGSLAFRGYPVTQFLRPSYLIGDLGVSAFFTLSGLIMMRQSADRFGAPHSAALFAWHRLIRIVPMYWIATLLWLGSKIYWQAPTPHAAAQLLLSLCFLPNIAPGSTQLQPVLGQGWTLNYEISFYLLFTLCLLLPRRAGLFTLIAVPVALTLAGRWMHPFPSPTSSAVFSFYTSKIILLFALGVVIGYLELRLNLRAGLRWPVSPAFLLVLPVPVLFAFPTTWGALSFEWGNILAALVVVACTVANVANPGWLTRALVLCGDASYSTYLFHLWIIAWVIAGMQPLSARFPTLFQSTPATMFILFGTATLAANLAGVLIHLAVERPLTRALRRIRFGPMQPRTLPRIDDPTAA